MATKLQKCPYCGVQIDRTKARTNCTNCAHALGPAEKRKSSSGEKLISIIILALLGTAVITVLLRVSPSSRGADDIGALTMCEGFVRNRLKAPSTGKFEWGPDTQRTKQGDGSYRISGWVDAQNSFGAMLRSDWVCVVEPRSGDRWRLVDLEVTPR